MSVPAFHATRLATSIGGQPVVLLQGPMPADPNRPQFTAAELLPGRGMNTFQIRAWLPGKGEISVLESPSPEDAKAILNGGPDDMIGNKSFSLGGATLLPYANRIRGKLSSDGKTLETTVMGKTVTLPANWQGKKPGAVKCAMHGLILDSKMDDFSETGGADQCVSNGTLHAGNFGGHWLSKTDVTFQTTLRADSFTLNVTAKNAGTEAEPVGIGWHPYFRLPSGNREQARLHVPGRKRALVDNYDDVMPTGKTESVTGTPYDFTAKGGVALGKLFMDDNFLDLEKTAEGNTVAEIVDPAAKYGLRITATSPRIGAVQVYAPVDKGFIVLEPQFNLADPYSKVWPSGMNTGMAVLQPGQSVTYSVKLEMFVP